MSNELLATIAWSHPHWVTRPFKVTVREEFFVARTSARWGFADDLKKWLIEHGCYGTSQQAIRFNNSFAFNDEALAEDFRKLFGTKMVN